MGSPEFGEPIEYHSSRRVNIVGLLLALVCAAGIAASITALYNGMAVIMVTEGGFVASGGPYAIAHPAPDWVGLVPLSIFGLFIFGGINIATSSRGWGINLVLFAWMGLFIALGWNFLRFGFNPPDNLQGAWAWIMCGIVFWIMGFAPAILAFSWARAGFNRFVDSQPNADTRGVWRMPTAAGTMRVYLVAQALGAMLGIWAGVALFAAVIA